jgi:hypothetical protein
MYWLTLYSSGYPANFTLQPYFSHKKNPSSCTNCKIGTLSKVIILFFSQMFFYPLQDIVLLNYSNEGLPQNLT